MRYEVRLSNRAEADIDSALKSLVKFSKRSASHWYSDLTAKIGTLENQPDRYAFAEESTRLGLPMREMLFGKRPHVYRVLYVVEDDIVNILHVRHAAQDWVQSEGDA